MANWKFWHFQNCSEVSALQEIDLYLTVEEFELVTFAMSGKLEHCLIKDIAILFKIANKHKPREDAFDVIFNITIPEIFKYKSKFVEQIIDFPFLQDMLGARNQRPDIAVKIEILRLKATPETKKESLELFFILLPFSNKISLSNLPLEKKDVGRIQRHLQLDISFHNCSLMFQSASVQLNFSHLSHFICVKFNEIVLISVLTLIKSSEIIFLKFSNEATPFSGHNLRCLIVSRKNWNFWLPKINADSNNCANLYSSCIEAFWIGRAWRNLQYWNKTCPARSITIVIL